jgi:hypothetical protein
MRISVGRCVATLAFALVLAAGCGAKGASKPADKAQSTLCQAPDDCPRGASCGCVGMDSRCNCELCQLGGACHSSTDSSCTPASDADCNQPGGACALYGFCHLVMTGAGAYCLPVSDDDCRSSLFCARWGSCIFDQQLQQCFARNVDDCAV